jgi:hypothetical protein
MGVTLDHEGSVNEYTPHIADLISHTKRNMAFCQSPWSARRPIALAARLHHSLGGVRAEVPVNISEETRRV